MPSDFKKVKSLIEEFLFMADDVKKDIELFFLSNLFFSILTYSDKSDVILGKSAYFEMPNKTDSIVDSYKIEKFKLGTISDLNNVRQEIYDICADSAKMVNIHNVFSINVPTGSGKTLAVINAAFQMLKADSSLKKIIYALPFTSIIDQTADILEQAFVINKFNPHEIFTIHHHLAEATTILDESYLEGDKAQFIIENWDKPFVLTTFWQLFHTLISNQNGQLRKLHNIADSVIILDEIQTLPHKYWLLANQAVKTFAEMFNCKIILLTATMPLIFNEENGEIYPFIQKEKRKEFFSKFSRYKIKTISNMNNISSDDFYKIAADHLINESGKSFLFVFNTIKSSLLFYRKLKSDFPEENLIYLSTNILPVDRKMRIDEIKKSKNRKIVVSTQLVEAGVDIDLDIVYRDFAPLDSIVQTAGRCNRNNRDIMGEVYLFKLKNEKGRNDCNYIYSPITLSATTEIFENRLETHEYDLLESIEKYYHQIKDRRTTKDSVDILNWMKDLDYDEISKNFRLIDESAPSSLIFIESCYDASNTLEKFEKIMKIENHFEKNNEFLKIRKEFFGFILSVRKEGKESFLDELEENQGIKILRFNKVVNVYDRDTGFVLESIMKQEEPTIFI